MDRYKKIYKKIIKEGRSNVSFADLQFFLEKTGFSVRCKGDHFIYTMNGINDIINIQPDGNSAKRYQIKQIKQVILKYKLGGNPDEE